MVMAKSFSSQCQHDLIQTGKCTATIPGKLMVPTAEFPNPDGNGYPGDVARSALRIHGATLVAIVSS